jgi:hypothetical protein
MEEKSQDLVVKQQTRVRWCWGFLGLWDENGVGNLNIITYFLSNGLDAHITSSILFPMKRIYSLLHINMWPKNEIN